jgi:hypothetical protein
VIRGEDEVDCGFIDEPNSAASMLDDAPSPITSAVRKAAGDDSNPFAESSDDEIPRNKRRFKPKDDFNPFDEPSPPVTNANPEDVFDFGAVDSSPPAPTGELDFDSTNPPQTDRPRRSRR